MTEPVWRTAEELATIYGVKPRTIRMWAYRGHTTRQGNQYDLAALADWWDNHRNQKFVDLRAQRRN